MHDNKTTVRANQSSILSLPALYCAVQLATVAELIPAFLLSDTLRLFPSKVVLMIDALNLVESVTKQSGQLIVVLCLA